MSGFYMEHRCDKCGKLIYTRTNFYEGKYQNETKNFLTFGATETNGKIRCQCGGKSELDFDIEDLTL